MITGPGGAGAWFTGISAVVVFVVLEEQLGGLKGQAAVEVLCAATDSASQTGVE